MGPLVLIKPPQPGFVTSGAEIKVGLPLFDKLTLSECSLWPACRALLTVVETRTCSAWAGLSTVLHPVYCPFWQSELATAYWNLSPLVF